jgi:hypothetical protein
VRRVIEAFPQVGQPPAAKDKDKSKASVQHGDTVYTVSEEQKNR